MNLKECAAEIKRQDIKLVADKYFSTANKKGYTCPKCYNGTGKDGTGAEIYFNSHNNRHELKCQKCGENWNALKLIAYGENLNLDDTKDLVAAVKIGCELYGLRLDDYSGIKQKAAVEVPTTLHTNELELIHADISAAQINLKSFLQTQSGNFRGLNLDTLKNFGCGYLPEWIHPKNRLDGKAVIPSRRFIIPTANHYNAILLPADRTDQNKSFWKMHAGTKEIFGADFLIVNADLILIVEGEIDAMSIWQATGGNFNVIAIGGAGEYKKAVKFLQDKFPADKPNVLILFDSDETGKDNAPKLRDELLKIGVPAVCKFLSNETSKVDANDLLQEQGGDKLNDFISAFVESSKEEFSTLENEIAEISAQSDSLEDELREIKQKLADFEQEKISAIEKLKSTVAFDKDTCFSDDVITAAAYAKLFDGKTFAGFKSDIQNQNKKNSFLLEWRGVVKDKAVEIKNRYSDLVTQKNNLQAKNNSQKFIDNNGELNGLKFPSGYSITDDGIEKVVGEKFITVARLPVVINRKIKNVEDKIFKLRLAYLAENGTWQELPDTSAASVFNARKLTDLAAYGLPVTSTNANLFVDYLDAFKSVNQKILPMSLNVSRCGWYHFGDTDYFVDPRRKCFIADDDRNIEIVVDDNSTFAKSLKAVGTLDQWKMAYEIAKKSPVARLIVAASVAPPLLKILGERNFLLYIQAPTRAGKTTALCLGASAVGDSKIIRSFDATRNGLAGTAADVNDYVFMIDEKQVADNRLKEQFSNLVYALANGVGRTKLNKDSTLKKLQDWRTIVIANGETPLLDDNTTGGAFSRLLSICAPKKILAADECKNIKDIIENNFGHALPLVVDELFKYGFDNLRDLYQKTAATFSEKYSNLLNEYCRYVAVLTVADTFLNIVLGVEENQAYSDALDNAKKIFELVPTIEEISDTEREKDFVLGFIAAKSAQFEGTSDFIKGREILGKFKDDFVFITTRALKQACDESNFDYKKVVSDLIDAKFFIADDKPRKDRKSSNSCVQKICGVATTCYRIPRDFVS